MRTRLGPMILALLALSSAGCWDLQEVDWRAFATTIGMDLDARGRTILSVQVPQTERMLPPGAGGGRNGKNFVTLSIVADTVREAFAALQTKTFHRLVIQQNKSIVLGESVLRASVTPHLDWLTRSPKTPSQALVFVADGHPATEILEFTPRQETLPGLQFYLAAQAQAKYDQTYFIPLWRFKQKMVHKSKDAYAPLVDLDEKHGVYVLAGLAVLSGDRMAGKLSPAETRLFGIVSGLIRGGVLSVRLPGGNDRLVLRNVGAKTRVRVLVRQGRPFFALETKVSGEISELSTGQMELEPADYRRFERDAARYLRPRLEGVVRKLQAWNADVIEFGEALRVQHQELWEKVDWRRVYPQAGFTLSVRAHITREGLF